MQINWYPGHMAKAKRLLQDQISKCDLIIEICDARLPFSSRNPVLDQLVENKRRLLLLNKADLADPSVSKEWIEFFRKKGTDAYIINANQFRKTAEIAKIEEALNETIEKAAAKGVRKTNKVMVIGVPNVGKSTYINHLKGERIAETGDKPGVTKSNRWIKVTPYLDLLDTPGLLWPRIDDQTAARRLCYIGSVKDGIVDMNELAIQLLQDIDIIRPKSLEERFKVTTHGLSGTELLDEVCRRRGFLLKGNIYDYDRCSSVILDEFRAGKLGRISLETPSHKTYSEE